MDLDPKALELFREGYDKILAGLAHLGYQTQDENFADTAFWTASLKSNKDGVAEVTFDTPDQLTAWKIRVWTLGERCLDPLRQAEHVAGRSEPHGTGAERPGGDARDGHRRLMRSRRQQRPLHGDDLAIACPLHGGDHAAHGIAIEVHHVGAAQRRRDRERDAAMAQIRLDYRSGGA